MESITKEKLEEDGWTRQTVMDEPRLSELVDFYKELAFEVVCLPVESDPVGAGCDVCFYDREKYKVIYTRKIT